MAGPVRRVALIGSRGHWNHTVRLIADIPELEIVAVADGGDNTLPLLEWCAQNGRPRPTHFLDHREMLDKSKADMVVVCGPFERHAEMCVDAIERGIHVLTEKPAALTLGELDRLRDAVARHPDVHLAGMMFSRYDPGFYTARKLIDNDAIGRVRLIDARKSYKLGKRPAYYHRRETYGGTIPWVGSHAIDWVLYFAAPRKFTRVIATHSSEDNDGNGTMERSAICLFTLEGERPASVSIDVFRPSKAPTHGDDWARIVGSSGVIEARPDSLVLINESVDGPTNVKVACDRHFMRDFVARAEGRGETLIDAAETLALTEACLRARESADTGEIARF